MKFLRNYFKRRRVRHARHTLHEILKSGDSAVEELKKEILQMMWDVAWQSQCHADLLRERMALKDSIEFSLANMANAKSLQDRNAAIDFALSEAKNEGFVAEFGVWYGRSLNRIAEQMQDDVVYGFDTFTGLPEEWRKEFPKGHFDTTGMNLQFHENCKIYKGLFADTIPIFLKNEKRAARLIHIDCDLYAGAKDVLMGLNDRIVSGTVIEFDEFYNYVGWREHEFRALNEWAESTGKKYKFLGYTNMQASIVIL